MSENETLQVLMADLGDHGGLIQLGVFGVTLTFLALAALMANRLFSMLEEARLLYWRSAQHLEAARALTGKAGAASSAYRLAAASAAHRRKLPGPGRSKDLLSS